MSITYHATLRATTYYAKQFYKQLQQEKGFATNFPRVAVSGYVLVWGATGAISSAAHVGHDEQPFAKKATTILQSALQPVQSSNAESEGRAIYNERQKET